MIAGYLIGLKINGAFVSCEISCSINMKNNNLPASAITSGGWKEFIYGIREWSVQVDGNLLLEAVPSDIKGLITTGFIGQYPMTAAFATRVSSTIQLSLSGAVLLDVANITAPQTGATNWNATLQGTGKLTATYQDFDLLIDAMPPETDWQTIVDELNIP
jgi:predicted secreted protein